MKTYQTIFSKSLDTNLVGIMIISFMNHEHLKIEINFLQDIGWKPREQPVHTSKRLFRQYSEFHQNFGLLEKATKYQKIIIQWIQCYQ